VSSPPVAPSWLCANGLGHLRHVRARYIPAGFLVLAASIGLFALSGKALAQFPIRQVPARPTQGPPRPPSGPAASFVQAPSSQTLSQPPLPAVARIVVPEKDGVSFGSGTLVDARGQFGLVVSNWHVVRDAAGQITVEFPDGFKSPAQVIKTDKDWDLAALSIYRPPVNPLPVSPQAPQPGESLTIAGYGSGQWRMAAGRCTQYLAPGVEFPHEMVELAAEARQGDSGGPILNERGELAGVLFGSGPGYTSGSYGGRVLKFLATVVPGGAPGTDGLPPARALLAQGDQGGRNVSEPATAPIMQPPQATALHQYEPPRETASAPYGGPPPAPPLDTTALTPALRPTLDPLLAPPPPREVSDRFGGATDVEVNPRVAVAPRRADLTASPLASVSALAIEPAAPLTTQLAPRVASSSQPGVDLNEAEPKQLMAAVWRQFGGETVFDQSKSVLAMIGVLALVVVFLRFGSQKEPEHHEE
jgi:hypothetical protein